MTATIEIILAYLNISTLPEFVFFIILAAILLIVNIAETLVMAKSKNTKFYKTWFILSFIASMFVAYVGSLHRDMFSVSMLSFYLYEIVCFTAINCTPYRYEGLLEYQLEMEDYFNMSSKTV